ncbi:MAG: rhomboid family intramembrane serine protease [Sedimentisphaerales bacterium]|nr:rhomboid family intramembrane serine protease [Sedimentisphaerales bacterium]
MFVPYEVDVAFNHRPVMNWVIVAGIIVVFCLQLYDHSFYSGQQVTITADPNSESGFSFEVPKPKGVTWRWLLDGWGLKGFFGHMWLHAGVLHLVGNLIFLWLFGNAVCSKLGNVLYAPIYILCGLAAAFSYLLFCDVPMLGASGAINGMVGMYLVFFPENSISCFFIFFYRPYWFTVRSFWMILLWFVFDMWGALDGGGGVAYVAHIGGFATGFALAILLLRTKVIVMEKDEKSLLQLLGFEKDDIPAEQEQRRDLAYWQQKWGDTAGEKTEGVRQIKQDKLTESGAMPFVVQKPEERVIRFRCRCGQRVIIAGKYAGLMGRCPKCSARLRIPSQLNEAE